MAKKKTTPPQSSTILNWFSQSTATRNEGKDKPSSKTTVSSTKLKRKKSTNTSRPDAKDIIVIPSDSEEELQAVTPVKKKRVELETSTSKRGIVKEETVEVQLKTAIFNYEASSSLKLDLGSFGVPNESLLPTNRTPVIIAENSQTTTSFQACTAGFGVPSMLLMNPPTNECISEAGPSGLAGECPKTKLSHGVEEFEVDWVMSDDEAIIEEDENDEVELVYSQPRPIIPNLEPTSSKTTLRPLTSLVPPPLKLPSKASGPNAYSVLMASNKENAAWREAQTAEELRPAKANGGRRKAPFYKVLQGMPIAVDAFRYGAIPEVTAYFLTHAHSDHYTNLSSSWKHGPIYCSEGTANLIKHMLNVDAKWVHPLPMDTPTVIPDTGGVQVTLIEANHCPGSCLFFFEGKQTVNAGDSTYKSSWVGSDRTFRYLHCGDFRASPRHVFHPAVRGKVIDHVYLDTTYLDPKYTFPPQPLVISACAELASRIVENRPLGDQKSASSMTSWLNPASKDKQKETENILMVVGTYSIGKERIVKAIAKALGSKVYCDARKTAILRCQADPEIEGLLTSDPLAASVHIVPLGFISVEKLEPYLNKYKGHFSKVVGFRPTGWTYSPPAGEQAPTVQSVLARVARNNYTFSDLHLARNSTSKVQLYPVPYSEHSSFCELTCFAMSIQWTKMIATVNVGSEASRGKMSKWMQKWEAERKKKGKDYVVPNRHSDYW